MTKLNQLIQHKISLPLSIAIGTGLGYVYWDQIGCTTGTCPMSSNPLMNMLTGAAIAYLLFSSIKESNNRK